MKKVKQEAFVFLCILLILLKDLYELNWIVNDNEYLIALKILIKIRGSRYSHSSRTTMLAKQYRICTS